MTTFVEFLTARYDEIEAAARGAARLAETEQWAIPEPRDYYDGMHLRDRGYVGPVGISWNHHPDEDPQTSADVDHLTNHIALHDPAHVLADIAAKRAILDLYDYFETGEDGQIHVYGGNGPETWYEVLQELALPFASHPEFDERWRP